jgi:outer membrane protein OmpA-like peptidoglycan-associated protein
MLFIPPPAKADREEVEEAGYLASASDLMVGLLFVFIIMVVILSQRVEEAESGSKNNDPLESAVRTIGKKIQQAGVPVVIDPASGVITLPADTLFPKGLAELNSGGIEVLGRAKVALNGILPCYIFSERKSRSNCPPNPNEVEIETIFIEGHTDSTPLQRGIYTNWHLGLDRAHAVYDVLTVGSMQDFKNERSLDVVGISSYADKRPNKDDPKDDAKNRRVELRFVLAFKPQVNKSVPDVKSVQDKLQKSVITK